MKNLLVILRDQLNIKIVEKIHSNKEDIIFLAETSDIFAFPKHHKKKIIFQISSMRHFAKQLEIQGYNVKYIELSDKNNTQNLLQEVKKEYSSQKYSKIKMVKPSEYYLNKQFESLSHDIEILHNPLNLSEMSEFSDWAKDRKELRMEYFYREMRLKHNILLDTQGKPEGGKWNYDKDNRKFSSNLKIPDRKTIKLDDITNEVIDIVEKYFTDHFGNSTPFSYAVTRNDALKILDDFIDNRLSDFGPYQDAMLENEPWLFHSHISLYINNGLLEPIECINKAEKAYREGKAPLNSVEGFIRQILGWREYIRGIYWSFMPKYKNMNHLKATNKLPEFYWNAKTDLNCLKQCIQETKENAYAHHIQRLMVLGNFALISSINPDEVNEWYWIVYADAYEWVELPNVTGMILFSDGGIVASKPYASSGSYINKMSNYCNNCKYDVKEKNGEKACPFNYLYWNFLINNKDILRKNQRLGMMYSQIDKMSDDKINNIKEDSNKFLKSIGAIN